jgi:hypothetical protein
MDISRKRSKGDSGNRSQFLRRRLCIDGPCHSQKTRERERERGREFQALCIIQYYHVHIMLGPSGKEEVFSRFFFFFSSTSSESSGAIASYSFTIYTTKVLLVVQKQNKSHFSSSLSSFTTAPWWWWWSHSWWRGGGRPWLGRGRGWWLPTVVEEVTVFFSGSAEGPGAGEEGRW